MSNETFPSFALMLLLMVAPYAASAGDVIHSFDLANGENPTGALVADANGNLYGTATLGGCNHDWCSGQIFELSPVASGKWSFTVLHEFTGENGQTPDGALILDGHGNLYGTTEAGGSGHVGTVFELSPQSNGSWTETVLHSFQGPDGETPHGAIALDAQGNIYGATRYAGANNQGVIYELSQQSNGIWKEAVLHAFGASGDPGYPYSGVTLDSHGNIFGATTNGGMAQAGTIFELTPSGNGQWTESTLHSFVIATDGANPQTPLVFDSAGNLYGSTFQEGGSRYGGTVFQLSPSGSTWNFTVLHSFASGTDGYVPSGVALDASGNVFGTTTYGGSGCYGSNYGGCGIVFELSPQGSGSWKKTVLHTFESATDGSQPFAGVILVNGQLYGTTKYGGTRLGYGTVFQVAP